MIHTNFFIFFYSVSRERAKFLASKVVELFPSEIMVRIVDVTFIISLCVSRSILSCFFLVYMVQSGEETRYANCYQRANYEKVLHPEKKI